LARPPSHERSGAQEQPWQSALRVQQAAHAALFGALGEEGWSAPAIAKAFDILGAKDGGKDPDVFEAELLDARLYRAEAQQKVVDQLDDFSRHMADDILDIGEKVMAPGQGPPTADQESVTISADLGNDQSRLRGPQSCDPPIPDLAVRDRRAGLYRPI
jgi:hypothetical protein